MKSDLIMAVNQICAEKELPRTVILKAIEDALVSAYRRNYASNTAVVQVTIDPEDGDLHIYCEKTIVEEVHDANTEISLEEAQRTDPQAELGGTVSHRARAQRFRPYRRADRQAGYSAAHSRGRTRCALRFLP